MTTLRSLEDTIRRTIELEDLRRDNSLLLKQSNNLGTPVAIFSDASASVLLFVARTIHDINDTLPGVATHKTCREITDIAVHNAVKYKHGEPLAAAQKMYPVLLIVVLPGIEDGSVDLSSLLSPIPELVRRSSRNGMKYKKKAGTMVSVP